MLSVNRERRMLGRHISRVIRPILRYAELTSDCADNLGDWIDTRSGEVGFTTLARIVEESWVLLCVELNI